MFSQGTMLKKHSKGSIMDSIELFLLTSTNDNSSVTPTLVLPQLSETLQLRNYRN